MARVRPFVVGGHALVAAGALLAIAAGVALLAAGRPDAAARVWLAGLIVTGLPVVVQTIAAARQGRFATDIVAMLAIVTAVLLREPVAGLVIVLMQTGGEELDRYAQRRASRAVRALEEAAPRTAHLLEGGIVRDVAATIVRVGDLLLVRPGELVPVDGVVTEGNSELDTSSLTGEVAPLAAVESVQILSGMANLSGSFHFRATAVAGESQYARIVELVRQAQTSKAPIQRMADRAAVWFTPITIAVCVLTFAVSGDWSRVLAVLVVATPCPLILAAPVAIIGGINKQARSRIIVRHGGALERLSQVTTVMFDKTGTLTVGRPEVSRVLARAPFDETSLLRLAAASEHGSGHLLARVVWDHAVHLLGHASIPRATGFRETAGQGIAATVEGRDVRVGSRAFMLSIPGMPVQLDMSGAEPGALRSYVAVDGKLAGAIEYADRLRPNVRGVLERLHALGVAKTLLLSGDDEPAVREVARLAGIDDARGGLLPGDKAAIVTRHIHAGEVVAMVGDGTNDAPALSAAHVGIALAAHGGGISAEAADVILLVDELDRVSDAVAISKRTMRIARQSVGIGLGLSGVAMFFAAAGHIQPVVGAVLQEAIDVAVIVNALRAAK